MIFSYLLGAIILIVPIACSNFGTRAIIAWKDMFRTYTNALEAVSLYNLRCTALVLESPFMRVFIAALVVFITFYSGIGIGLSALMCLKLRAMAKISAYNTATRFQRQLIIALILQVILNFD